MNEKQNAPSFTDHLAQQVPAILVLTLSLWLFVFAAQREAERTYPRSQLEKLAHQGELTKNTMERFLKAGVQLKQFVGFSVITDQLLGEGSWIQEIAVFDLEGQLVFFNSRAKEKADAASGDPWQVQFDFDQESEAPETSFKSEQQNAYYRVTLPLADKFEEVGSLSLLMPKSLVKNQIEVKVQSITTTMIICVLIFGLVLFFIRGVFQKTSRALLLATYILTFVIASLLVNRSLQTFSVEGLKESAASIGKSLAERLSKLNEVGLKYDDLSKIQEAFTNAKAADPHLDYAALVENGAIRFHSDPSLTGTPWTDPPETLNLLSPLASSGDFVAVGISKKEIIASFWQIIIDYAPLFFTALLLSSILLWLFDHFLIRGFKTLKIPAIFVLSCSFVLLFYVGVGEAYRSYPKLQLENLAAQGDSIKMKMENFLFAGVALKQFVGFETLTNPILATDPNIAAIEVFDEEGNLLFSNSGSALSNKKDKLLDTELKAADFEAVSLSGHGAEGHQFYESPSYYRALIPLRNKFEKVGELILTTSTDTVTGKINTEFKTLAIWMSLVIGIFSLIVFTSDKIFPKRDLLKIVYGLAFFFAASLVVYTLTNIYSYGIQGKAKALSISIGKRFETAMELELSFDDFSGITKFFQGFRSINPEIDAITLIEQGKHLIHTDPDAVGTAVTPNTAHFEYATQLDIKGPNSDRENQFQVSVSIPKKTVYAKLWRSVKNFFVLFIATAFLATLFLGLIQSLNTRKKLAVPEGERDESAEALHAETQQALIKILYFLVVFMEGLFASFLPQYLQNAAIANQMESGSASILFTVYFAAFAFSLIPSGNYADKHGVKLLMVLGVTLTAVSVYLLPLIDDFYTIMVLRIFAGLGQGMVFIGVQSFILLVASKTKTTQGTSIIVFGYNTGMISGTAIGALLIIYMGPDKVFTLSAAIGLFIISFILFLIPEVRKKEMPTQKTSSLVALKNYLANLTVLFRDLRFLKTMMLIGLTTKATLTGIVVYALPLVMARLNFLQDDIGQVLMFYAAGVLLSNLIIPKIADKMDNTAKILFWGTLGSGFGLILIGLIQKQGLIGFIPFSTTIFLIIGISVLGFAHGFIHAPIVTHIAFSKAASVLGKGTTTSIYRFLERFGHIGGPLIIGHILVLNQYNFDTFGYIGAALILFGILFVLWGRSSERPQPPTVQEQS